MNFLKKHKIAAILIPAVALFAAYGFFFSELGVERVEQGKTPSAEQVSNTLAEQEAKANSVEQPQLEDPVKATGTFVDGRGTYKGSGSLQIVTIDGVEVLKFNSDFSTTNGPDLQVYLSPNASAKESGLGEFVTLGELKAQSREQVYTLPQNWNEFASVVVWCRTFKGVFTEATFTKS